MWSEIKSDLSIKSSSAAKIVAVFACIGMVCSSMSQAPISPRNRDGQGGGFANGGLNGEYFANPTFSGLPAFTRRDVRISFDWNTYLKPGGSRSTDVNSVGLDNYSIRWTGTLIPRFSETYTFYGNAKDSFRFEIRRAGDPNFTQVLNIVSAPNTKVSGNFPLQAGQKYDVRIHYTALTGAQHANLQWSSPSTPVEVISPATQASVNVNTYFSTLWANAADAGRNWWQGVGQWDPGSGGVDRPAPTMDANGWPNGEYFALIIHEIFGTRIQPLMRGPLRMTFSGRATVLFTTGNLTFDDGTTQQDGTALYDPVTNTTTAMLRGVDRGWNIAQVGFSGARRTNAVGAAPGITNLKIMCPTQPDGTVNVGQGIIFHPLAKQTFSRFTALRINMNTNNREVNWADRTLPNYFNQSGGRTNLCPVFGPGASDPEFWRIANGMSWEHQIMFCNETGKDMHIDIPHLATDDYMRRVAQLIRYGSDGVNPYTAPQANPVYPPLNPNLKVYVELGNELWNWGSPRDYPAWHTWIPTIRNELSANSVNARIYNYDNRSTALDSNNTPVEYFTFFHRRCLLRTYQMSEIFRNVFSDVNMMSRVRPLMFGWYNNIFGVQEAIYGFADNYFNNAAGANVPNANWSQPARPLNSYVFGGGGGAHYFGSGNPNGFVDGIAQGSFESPAVGNGYSLRPTGGPWTFTGPAGLARTAPSSEVPTAYTGQQVAYLNREAGVNGSMSTTFTVPNTAGQVSQTYGLAFRAVTRVKPGASAGDQCAIRIYVNNNQVTYGEGGMVDASGTWSQVGFMPLGWNPPQPWYSRQGWFYADLYVFTRSFTATPGSTVTIRIDSSTTLDDQMVFIDDLRLTSVDGVFAGGVPGAGQAFGQVTSGTYDYELFGQSNWAQAYGLEYVTYEGGWSLGGDNGGSFVQNMAKYKDPRAAQSNVDSMRSFHRAGGFLPTFGTYDQWPTFDDQLYEEGLADSSAYPLVQGIDRVLNMLPIEPENGAIIPTTLTARTSTLTMPTNAPNAAAPAVPGGWLGWNIVAPQTGDYQIDVNATAGGTLRLVVNGRTLREGPGGNSSTPVRLAKGIHHLRIQARAVGFTVNTVTVRMVNTLITPVITSVTEGSGSATIQWTRSKGPSAYIVRYGEQSDRLHQQVNVGSSNSYTITNLAHGRTYYVEVVASSPAGLSMPSEQRSFTALVNGQSGPLVSWDFTGAPSDQAAAAPTGATSRLVVTPLARGAGYIDPPDSWTNSFQIYPSANNIWAQSMVEAAARNEYVEFSFTPNAATRASLDSINLWAGAQGATAGGVGVTYRVGAGAWSAPLTMGTFSQNDQRRRFTLNLSSIAGLQNLSSTVTIRISLFGNAQWNWGFLGLDSDTPSNRVAPADRPDIELIGRLSNP